MAIDFHITYEFVIAILAATIGLSTGYLLLRIRDSPQEVLTKFKLDSDSTARDFKILFISEITLTVTFLLYIAAGILEKPILTRAARIILPVFTASVGVVFIRQWRRSR
ncbi:MAG: Na+/H+ antiporter NhaD/arsenite permease-like protein [Candidatus Nanohaloarchaea archaeon]|jgi:Na+/H+ antiporter NhaD/arsenite permease-like protein